MAQIMYYWKHPSKVTSTIPGYTSSTLKINVPSIAGGTSINWGNMIDSYPYNSFNTVQADAVAQLMYYVGVSVHMDYNTSSSGAWPSVESLKNYFGYDTNAKTKNRYSNKDTWDSILKSQIDALQPIIYVGGDDDQKAYHAFVCDGYKYQNGSLYFHFNWGWGGNKDNYCVTSALIPDGASYDFSRNTSYERIYIDIKPASSSTCSVPTGLSSSSISTNSATLKWNTVLGAQNYTVEYKLASAANWTVATTTATSYTISGLNANTTYSWRVKTNCSSSNSSEYTQSSFNTLSICSAPAGLVTSNISTSSATLKWNTVLGAQNYTVEYKLSSAANWTVATTTATSYTISGLNANTAYSWRVKTNCSSSNSSGYIQSSFNTLSVCSIPTGLTTSNLSTNGVTLKWNAVTGAQNYRVEYKPASVTSWSVATTSATAYSISGLNANTAYSWRVKTNCSSSNSSGYIQSSFATLSSSCINNYEPNESFAAAVPINTNTTYSAGIGSATDKDYYKFTISSKSNVTITLENLPKDYDIKLYNSSQTLIGGSAKGGTTNEAIVMNNLTPGTYYVYVYGFSGQFDLTQCYNLRVNASIAISPCINNYEPNDSFAEAVPINTNTTYSAGIGSATDKDYYKFTISSKSNVTITLENLPKDYDIKLYNSSQTLIGGSARGGTNNEAIIMNNLAPGTYYVYVYGFSGQFDLTQS